MNHSLNDIATQIVNAVYAGLKKPSNYSLSIEQVKDEFAQARNRFIETQVMSGVFEAEPFRQTIPKLPVSKKDFSGIPNFSTNRQEFHASIPEIMHFPGLRSVGYVAAINKVIPFKIVVGNDIFYVLKDKYTGSRPTAWIQDTNLWLLNPPIQNIQYVVMRAIFENPRSLNGVAGMKFVDDDPYPVPGSVIDAIRNKMVNDYIRQYRMANVQPTLLATDMNNTQEQ
jgi:hypothetical protein